MCVGFSKSKFILGLERQIPLLYNFRLNWLDWENMTHFPQLRNEKNIIILFTKSFDGKWQKNRNCWWFKPCMFYVSIKFLSTYEKTTTHFDKMVLFKQVIDHDISPLTLDLLYMVLKSEKNWPENTTWSWPSASSSAIFVFRFPALIKANIL